MNGQLCPEIAHAPETAEGRIAAALACSPGLARRAGMAGAIAGIDFAGALALAPSHRDGELLRACLIAAEQGLLTGLRKRERD